MTHTSRMHSIEISQRYPTVHLALLALTVAMVFLAMVSAASAGTARLYQSSIGPLAPSNGEETPTAFAVDQSNGDLYAVTSATAFTFSVLRFDSMGAPKSFTSGPNAGTNVLITAPGQGSRGASVAIDNSGGPLDGSIYVNDPAQGGGEAWLIKVFAPTGAQLGAIAGTGTNNGEFPKDPTFAPRAIAVDQSDGSLYVGQSLSQEGQGENEVTAPGKVYRFAPAAVSGTIDDDDYTLTGITAAAEGLAADDGDVYVIRDAGGGKTALYLYSAADFGTDFKLVPPSTQVATGTLGVGITAVAVDPATGEVYADEGNRIAVYDPDGVFLYRFGFSAYFGTTSEAVAVDSAVAGAAAKAYVGDLGNREADVFGPEALAPSYVHEEVAAFGPDGTAASQFSNSSPNRLAFDQATRRLFAADDGNTFNSIPSGIFGFDASAPPAYPPLGAFDPLSPVALDDSNGESSIAADSTALSSSGNLYLVSRKDNLIYGWDDSGTPLGGAFPIDSATSPGAPNGSPKELRGVAVDSAGNVWVANGATKRILKYSSAGAYLGAVDTTAQGTPGEIALAANDDLYVRVGFDIWRYTAASSYASASKIVKGQSGFTSVFTIDPASGHLFVTGSSWVDEYDSSGNLLDEFALGHGYGAGIAVDAANGYVYLSSERKVRVYTPGFVFPEVAARPATDLANSSVTLNGTVATQGAVLTDCHFEYVTEAAFEATGFADLSSGGSLPCEPPAASIPLDLEAHPVSAAATGLAKDTRFRFRLVAANADGDSASAAEAFSTAAKPLVETTGTPLRTTTTAQLLGRVDPSRAPATYHFEYGTEGPCDANPCAATTPVPVPAGDEFRLVAQDIQGLSSDTTYHYRLIAENGNPDGPAVGEDMTITTRVSDAPLSHGRFPGPPGSDRAYELVTMPDSGGNPVSGINGFSIQGDRALYGVFGGTPLSESGSLFSVYFAERPAGEHPTSGWQTRLITPPRDPSRGADGNIFGPLPDDLSSVLYYDTGGIGSGLGQQVWRLSPDAPAEKLFETLPSQRFEKAVSDVAVLPGLDTDLALVRLEGPPLDPAYPAAAAVLNTYDVSSGAPKLVSLLPGNEVAACRSDADPIDDIHVLVSSPGNSCSAPKRFYVRDLDAAQSVPIAPEPISGPYCQPVVNRAREGAIFFTSASRFVAADVTPAACSESSVDRDVYRYEIATEALECLTCGIATREAGVSGSVAVAANGSRIYFTSSARLLPGTPPMGSIATYRLNLGTDALAYVAPVGVSSNDFLLNRDGSAALIRSADPALNTIGGAVNGGSTQLYRYSDENRSLVCISCPTDGSAPTGPVPVIIPPPTDDGTAAFSTPTPLVSRDQNTVGGAESFAGKDVYEWRDGRLFLITDGLTLWTNESTGPWAHAITPSGRDLVFSVGARLTSDAIDSYNRVYDARIGGGIDFPPPKVPCPLEVCQGIPRGAPEEQQAASENFRGSGNRASATSRRCPKGKVRRRSRCVKKQRPRPKRHNRANSNRRAQR